MIKIIYITGDGRSGSTLLDSILANGNNTISVGECHRFWIRFYEKETLCGCGEKIEECDLWRDIDQRLSKHFSTYDPVLFRKQVEQIQYYSSFRKIPTLINSEEWFEFKQLVTYFYVSICDISGKSIIIDSSKSISWAYMLQQLNEFDVRVIHIERNLASVANSWKKKILLPEYNYKEVYMPTKSNYLIAKNWLKIKLMSSTLKINGSYIYVPFESFVKNSSTWIRIISKFTEIKLKPDSLLFKNNHAIGGNPMRHNRKSAIVVQSEEEKLSNLNLLEKVIFKFINALAKLLIR